MWGGNGPVEEKLFLSYFKQRLLLKEQTKKQRERPPTEHSQFKYSIKKRPTFKFMGSSIGPIFIFFV